MTAAPLFDATALTLFFEDAGSMGLSNRTHLQLAQEGIVGPKDFKEFDEEGLSAIISNLFKPPKVPAAGAAALAVGKLHEILAYEVSAKSKMRLKGAVLIAKFYNMLGILLTLIRKRKLSGSPQHRDGLVGYDAAFTQLRSWVLIPIPCTFHQWFSGHYSNVGIVGPQV
jgi:hypothetical protein